VFDFIKNTINPPGLHKPGRLALFGVVGEVAERVRLDAVKAFNAHFPYLADERKLEEHGNALLVPHMPDDTPQEYRDRVAAASFTLSLAGERGYILDQLTAHFGDRFTTLEQFLVLAVKVRDLADADRRWLQGFLDELINPVVRLTVSEWFYFIDALRAREGLRVGASFPMRDAFRSNGVTLDGGRKLDGAWKLGGEHLADRFHLGLGTRLADLYRSRWKLNGAFRLDGTVNLSGEAGLQDVASHFNARFKFSERESLSDAFSLRRRNRLRDWPRVKLDGEVTLSGGWKLRGRALDRLRLRPAEHSLSEAVSSGDSFYVAIRHLQTLNGAWRLDGSLKLNGGLAEAA